MNKEQEAFLEYWKENREREKKTFRQFATGLPVGCVLAAAILITIFSGWDKRVDASINTSLNPVVLIVALLIIVTFVAIFYKKHQWDQKEEHYWTLLKRKEKEEKKQTTQQ